MSGAGSGACARGRCGCATRGRRNSRAVKRNKECFSLDAEGQMAVDWERLIVSEGEVAAPVFVGVETRPAASLQIGFEWDGGSGDDEVYVYAYCPELEEGVLSAPAWRRMKSVQLALPERWQGKEVHLYGFAVDEEGAASATAYIGSLSPVETRPAASPRETIDADVDRETRQAASLQMGFEWDGGRGDDGACVTGGKNAVGRKWHYRAEG